MTEDQWIDGEGIRLRLRTSGKTQRQLGVALGIDASGVSRLLDGGRKLRDDELVRIRAFFDPAAEAPAAPPATYRLGPARDDTRPRRPRPGPGPMRRASVLGDIPVYGAPTGRGDPFFRFPSGPIAEYRARPDQLLGVEDAFAIFAPGDILRPRYRSAEVLHIHPRRPPVAGSDCLLRMRDPEGAAALLRYLGENETAIGFSSVTSPYPCGAVPHSEVITIMRRDVAQIGRIVLISAD